jgi:hypothetical protein
MVAQDQAKERLGFPVGPDSVRIWHKIHKEVGRTT